MDTKYAKWAALDKEMEEEERAELEAKRREIKSARAQKGKQHPARGLSLEESYAAALDEKKDDLDLTREESDKFKKAFKDPKFMGMMQEYMEEISDPKHRQEQEAYIKQLEGEGKVPQGKEMVKPSPGFVVKTQKSEDDGKSWIKLFINIVHSGKIAKASFETKAGGQQWSLPYALGPMRMEKDKSGGNTPAIDCCFATETLSRARNVGFRNMLMTTAIEAVEKQMINVGHGKKCKVKHDARVLKGVTYKSGDPVMLMCGKETMKPGAKGDLQGKKSGEKLTLEGLHATLTGDKSAVKADKEAPTSKSLNPLNKLAKPAVPKGFLNKKGNASTGHSAKPANNAPVAKRPLISELSSTPNPDYNPDDELKAPKSPSSKSKTAVTKVVGDRSLAKPKPGEPLLTPDYRVVESGNLDMAQFLQATYDRKGYTQRPKELRIMVYLPLLQNTKGVDLHIEQPGLEVGSTGQPIAAANGDKDVWLVISDGKIYHLRAKLPYQVLEDKGSAKFDKSRKQLQITMPVALPALDKPDDMPKAEVATEHNIKDGELDDEYEMLEMPDEEDLVEPEKEVTPPADATSEPPTDASTHSKFVERGKQPVVMKKLSKKEKEAMKSSEWWAVNQDPEQLSDIEKAVQEAKAAFRVAKAKDEAEAKAKQQALMAALERHRWRSAKELTTSTPSNNGGSAVKLREKVDSVSMMVQVCKVVKESIHFVWSGGLEGNVPSQQVLQVRFEAVETFLTAVEDSSGIKLKAFEGMDALDGDEESVPAAETERRVCYKINFWPCAGKELRRVEEATELNSCIRVADKNMVLTIPKAASSLGKWPSLQRDEDRVDVEAADASQAAEDLEDSIVDTIEEEGENMPSDTSVASVVDSIDAKNLDAKQESEKDENDDNNFDRRFHFNPSKKFRGSREGFVFKTGEEGLGYYRDVAKIAQEHNTMPLQPTTQAENAVANITEQDALQKPQQSAKRDGEKENAPTAKKNNDASIDSANLSFHNKLMFELE